MLKMSEEPADRLGETPAGSTVVPEPHARSSSVSRRRLLVGGLGAVALAGVGSCAAAAVMFGGDDGTSNTGGLPESVVLGRLADLQSFLRIRGGWFHFPDYHVWLTSYDGLGSDQQYPSSVQLGMSRGVVALYDRCPDDGCTVTACASSGWFECSCSGSRFNRAGEKKDGPASRGLDRFAISIGADGSVRVRTGEIVLGPPIGTNTTDQDMAGPHCTPDLD